MVTDESKVPVDENNESSILTNLLLTADLRGYVEQPGYYFAGNRVSHLPELDLLLLTQGYRRYVWVPGADSTVKYLPEKYLQLSGVAKSAFGNPIENGDITLIGRNGGPMLKQVTDKYGAFKFANLVFQDSTAFIIRATYNKGKSINKIVLDRESTAPVIHQQDNNPEIEADALMTAYLNNALNLKEEMGRYGLVAGKQLKQVDIKSQRVKPPYRTLSYVGAGGADQVLHMKDIKGLGGQLSDVLNGRLRGVTIINGTPVSNYGGPMLIVVDGVQSQKGSIKLNDIPPSDVKTIEVLKYTNAFVYAEGHNGVIVITTKQGGEGNDYTNTVPAEGMLPVTLTGFHKAREFYIPKYDNVNINSPRADLRTTICWKPDLVTDKDGNTTFSFFNADDAGSYRVVVEGIDNKGAIGRRVYRYTVK